MRIRLSRLILDDTLRARALIDPVATHRLFQAYQAGARFPPLLAQARTFRLVDGYTRYDVYQKLDIDTAEIVTKSYKSEADIFADAVRINSAHGEPLSSFDLKTAIARLIEFGITRDAISEIVRIPVPRIDEIVRGFGHGAAGVIVPLKHGLEFLKDQRLTAKQIGAMRHYGGQPATWYVNQLILLLENDLWPRDQPNFATAMSELVDLWLKIIGQRRAA